MRWLVCLKRTGQASGLRGVKNIAFVLIVAISGRFAFGQSRTVPLFTDVQDFRRALAVVPKTDSVDSDFSLFDAHVNRGLGAEFNPPMSLTAVFCARRVAVLAIEDSISGSLKHQGYDTFAGWDKFGFLTAEKSGHALIFKTPPQYEDIKLHVKVDQDDFNERAITIDYEIRAGVRASDQGSWSDESSTEQAKHYIDDLRGQLREAAEGALRNHCQRAATAGESKDELVRTLGRDSRLTTSQIQAVQTAIGK